jgi:carotenoid cleavage dioxygenase-like enzyme
MKKYLNKKTRISNCMYDRATNYKLNNNGKKIRRKDIKISMFLMCHGMHIIAVTYNEHELFFFGHTGV